MRSPRWAYRLDETEAGEIGFGGKEVEGGTEGSDHLMGQWLLGGRGHDQLLEMVADGVKGGEEALLLGVEDQVEVTCEHRGELGELGDRDRAVAAIGVLARIGDTARARGDSLLDLRPPGLKPIVEKSSGLCEA